MKKLFYFLIIFFSFIFSVPLVADTQEKKTSIENILDHPSFGKQWLNHLVKAAKHGIYDSYLKKIDVLYAKSIKEDKITFLKEITPEQKEKFLQKLSQLEEKTNDKLYALAEKNPGLEISTIIKTYIKYYDLKIQNIKTKLSLDEILQETKKLEEKEEHLLKQIKNISNEYSFKKSLLKEHFFLSDKKMSAETYFSLKQLLEMEKYEKLQKLCKQNPDSSLTNNLKKRITAFHNYFAYMYEENYLLQLGSKEKNKKYKNKAEEAVAKIMSYYIAKKPKHLFYEEDYD